MGTRNQINLSPPPQLYASAEVDRKPVLTWHLMSISKKLSSGTSLSVELVNSWLMTSPEFRPGKEGSEARWSFMRDTWKPATMSISSSLAGEATVQANSKKENNDTYSILIGLECPNEPTALNCTLITYHACH